MRKPLYFLIELVTDPSDTAEVRLQKSVLVTNIELTNSLILPLAVLVGLGGFVQSGAVVTWSLIAPLRAVLTTNRQATLRWFFAFLGIVLLSALIDATVYRENQLLPVLKTAFFVLNISAPSAIAILITLYFVEEKNSAQELLKIEQEKSERLLLNVLPKEIAGILKDENRTIADRFDAVSVLFADIVGFTPLSAELDPVEMVNLLNEVFSYFDTLVARYGLEKIRTIGDNYMVASGIPTPRADHAQALANLALEMRDFMGHIGNPHADRLQFRIGVNYGPAVAGVIGQEKFHYDVWGDAVNVAARMESQGRPGMIQITDAMAQLLKDDFICEPRGTIEIKGKGEMQTWFLVGRKTLGNG